ncbi:MAG: thiosulfate oxidation carrier complex protein SoxZ [Arenicellales bacterium]|jgi:sulfur-oxidizing protein SoxZ|nr:thiosulfate oxidation carrier complex protein SoxZ [Acidiferrobacteraceae bacterium]MDP6139871.1 thiosulfate oxidation carrier complex protein SoxZ [Arenicellales bacterium]MDP7120089.1 thiosulfate oxidation carrier complex protein SoxZ [Arenicellales bacterium]MDP7193612.1 thiosulfate oxidation carrier complex protein SoxZ [Arenicellales bacterium]MDP7490845.1 thiosulfate oxidation carrier complex protein SoxZ [Arenicellales bacterium]|tara:strand:+ start:1525 stop:1839 length:315 start_codon:yes stop_codon:yes gene_type:complete
MATTKMKIRKNKAGGHDVMVLAKHPMETGLRKDKKTGEKIPAHFIQTMEFALNGTVVAQANLGAGVSKNPLIGIAIAGASSGDTVSVSWIDNKGEGDSAETVVK